MLILSAQKTGILHSQRSRTRTLTMRVNFQQNKFLSLLKAMKSETHSYRNRGKLRWKRRTISSFSRTACGSNLTHFSPTRYVMRINCQKEGRKRAGRRLGRPLYWRGCRLCNIFWNRLAQKNKMEPVGNLVGVKRQFASSWWAARIAL